MIPELLYTPLTQISVQRPNQQGQWETTPGVQLQLSNYEFEALVRLAQKYRHLEPDLPSLSDIQPGEYNGPR